MLWNQQETIDWIDGYVLSHMDSGVIWLFDLEEVALFTKLYFADVLF